MHTKDKLAEALDEIGLTEMAGRAREGYYHDFLSPLDFPELQLMSELMDARTPAALDLRQRVMNGEFDASREESEEWAASEEGKATFDRLRRGQ